MQHYGQKLWGLAVPPRAPRRVKSWPAQRSTKAMLWWFVALLVACFVMFGAAFFLVRGQALDEPEAYMMLLLLSLSSGVSAVGFALLALRPWRKRRLLEHGHLVWGEVEGVEVAAHPPSKLLVGFRDLSGAQQQLKVSCSGVMAVQVRSGDRVHVLLPPTQGGGEAWAPLEEKLTWAPHPEAEELRGEVRARIEPREVLSQQAHQAPLWSLPEAWSREVGWLRRSWFSREQLRAGTLYLDEVGIKQQASDGHTVALVRWAEPFSAQLSTWLLPGGEAELCLTLRARGERRAPVELRCLIEQRRVDAQVSRREAHGPYLEEAAMAQLLGHVQFFARLQGSELVEHLDLQGELRGQAMAPVAPGAAWGEEAPLLAERAEPVSQQARPQMRPEPMHRPPPPGQDLIRASQRPARWEERLFDHPRKLLLGLALLLGGVLGFAALPGFWYGPSFDTFNLFMASVLCAAFLLRLGIAWFQASGWRWGTPTRALVRRAYEDRKKKYLIYAYQGHDGRWYEALHRTQELVEEGTWCDVCLNAREDRLHRLMLPGSRPARPWGLPARFHKKEISGLQQALRQPTEMGRPWYLRARPILPHGRLGHAGLDRGRLVVEKHQISLLRQGQVVHAVELDMGARVVLGELWRTQDAVALCLELSDARDVRILCCALLPASAVPAGLPQVSASAPWLATEQFVALYQKVRSRVGRCEGHLLLDEPTEAAALPESLEEQPQVEVQEAQAEQRA